MSAGARVATFAVGLVVAGGLGAGVGALAGPVDTGAGPAPSADHGSEGHLPSEGASTTGPPTAADGAPLASGDAAWGLELSPLGADLSFRVLDPDGAPVVATEVRHERPLHLIVVGRDLVTYAHLHPAVAADGTWSTPAPDLPPGSYRVVADVVPEGGPELALTADLTVPGPVAAPDPPVPAATDEVADLTVEMAGDPVVGEADLTFTVRRGDEVVTPDPYLGARGHLVAVRARDLAYSHVHPHDGDGPAVAFSATFASPGRYRLFLDIEVEGEVRTAAFTVEVPATTDEPGPTAPAPIEDGHDHEHD